LPQSGPQEFLKKPIGVIALNGNCMELVGLVTVSPIDLPECWAVVVERQGYEHWAILDQSMLCGGSR